MTTDSSRAPEPAAESTNSETALAPARELSFRELLAATKLSQRMKAALLAAHERELLAATAEAEARCISPDVVSEVAGVVRAISVQAYAAGVKDTCTEAANVSGAAYRAAQAMESEALRWLLRSTVPNRVLLGAADAGDTVLGEIRTEMTLPPDHPARPHNAYVGLYSTPTPMAALAVRGHERVSLGASAIVGAPDPLPLPVAKAL